MGNARILLELARPVKRFGGLFGSRPRWKLGGGGAREDAVALPSWHESEEYVPFQIALCHLGKIRVDLI